MKLLLKVLILNFFFISSVISNEFSFTFDWGNLKSCTSGKPNKVSNPIFELKNVPEGTRELRFNTSWSGASLDATVNRSVLIAEEMMGSKALVSQNGFSHNMQPDIIFAHGE